MDFLFNDSIDTTSITNVLLIDKDTHDYEIFYNSCNGTTFPIVYSRRSSRNDLLQLLNNKFSNINRLCFVFSLQLGYVFLNNEFLFRDDESSPYSENVTFIINLINQFNISTVDYLACDTLKYDNWQNYYNIILSNTTAIVGASNDRTGNLKYGGDWTMESTGQDIETIYFNSQIQNYQQLLDGAESNYVIMDNGTVYACGFNDRDMLGIGTSSGSGLHLMINNTGKTPSAISVGRYHAIILMTDGTIYGLGENTYGQLGTGSTSFSSPLVQMVNTTGKTPVSVSCGVRFTIVLMSDGTIYGCGRNTDNQLGPGWPGDDILTLKLMPNNTGKIPVMVEAAGGVGVTILMTDGTIYSTGRNSGNSESVGRYGNGTTTSVVGLNQMINNTGKTPVSISSSGGHTMVLMDDGTVYGTGYNLYGQLLNGNTTSQTTLVQMINTTGKTPVGIATGPGSTFILMSDNTVYSAGFNNQGQLGRPVATEPTYASAFGEVGNTTGKTIRAISVAESFTTFLMTDGTVYGVGAGYGIYTTSSPSSVSSLSIPMTIPTGLTPIALPDQRVYGSLSNFSIPTKTYIDSDFTITQPTTTSSGSFSYSSSNTSVATVSGNTITIVGIGTTTITASQARTATHTPATTTTTFQVDKITPSINNLSLPTRRYGTSPFIITTPTSTSNGTFSYVSSDESVATVSGNIITIVGAGTATITSTQAETEFYKSETVTSTIQVSKAIPSISSFSIPTKNYEDSTFTITPPTSNSSGSFSYVSSDESVATISGDTVTIVGVGTANIIATQTETSEFTPGSIISSFQVGKAVLSISDFSIPTKTYGDSPFTITPPTSDSNGSFNYISADPSVATISGNTITIVGAGTANILAIQTKTSGYTSGTITASFTVSKAIPTIGNFSIQTRTVGDSPFTITQPTSNSNGTFTYISTDTSVATISGNTVTVVGAGSSVIIAIQGKTTNYSSGVAFTDLQILSPA